MKRTLLVLFLLAMLALAGCSTPSPTGEDAGEGGGAVESHDALAESLAAAGLEIQQNETLLDTFFPDTTAQFLTVNDQMIQTFEFPDATTAEAAAATVNEAGNIIGNITVDWVEPPHFYQSGRLIVLYAGQDGAILDALQSALGEPFVIGDVIMVPPTEEP
jgi:predicted small secreted protein